MSTRFRGSGPVLLCSAIALAAGCSDDPASHLLAVPASHVTVNEDEPFIVRPLTGVMDPSGHPLKIFHAVAGKNTVTISDDGQELAIAPERDFYGSYVITYKIENGGPVYGTGTINVDVKPVNDAPVATAGEVTIRRVGSLPLSATDAERDAVKFAIVTPPSHGSIEGDNASGFRYVPAPDFAGDDRVEFAASDRNTGAAAAILIHVVADAIPVWDTTAIAAAEDQTTAFQLRGSDSDDPSSLLAFAVTVPPTHGSLTGTPPFLQYRPAQDYNGEDALTFTISDGFRTSEPYALPIHVAAVNDAAVPTPQTVTVDEDGSVVITMTGSDIEGDLLSFQLRDAPTNGTLSPQNGATVRYTPRRDFNGTDRLTFVALDGKVVSPTAATVTIRVMPVNDPPTTAPTSLTLAEDAPLAMILTAGDVDADPLTFAVATTPQHGRLTGNPPSLTYTPDHDYNGPDSFTYTASDRTTTSAPATVSLQIRPVNDAPAAQSASVTLDEDTAGTIALTATDVDSTALTYSIRTSPTDGSVALAGNRLTYTPAPNANGTRSLTYVASDGLLTSNTATITFQITPINDAPITTDDYLTADPGAPVTFTVTGNDVDIEADPIQLDSVEAPSHGTIEMAAGQLTYTPDDDAFAGVDTFGYTVVDSHGAASTGAIHIGRGGFPKGAPTETLVTGIFEVDRDMLSISGDGRYIAFTALGALVPEDTNNAIDIYVYDRGHRSLARTSLAHDSAQANASCFRPQISADGRYLLFESDASNLVPGDNNGVTDVFRRDLRTGETVRITVPLAAGGTGGGATGTISDDGNLVAFSSTAFDLVANDVNGASDVFVRDVAAGVTTRVSMSTTAADGDLGSFNPSISGDGHHVVFTSEATNFVPGDTNNLLDVFSRDLVAGTTSRASVSTNGTEANGFSNTAAQSRDGRYVSFISRATNLVAPGGTNLSLYVRDTSASITTRLTSTAIWSRLSGDGRFLVAQTSSTGVDMFDRFAGTSASLSGTRSWMWPVISSDGHYIAVLERRDGIDVLTVAPNPSAP